MQIGDVVFFRAEDTFISRMIAKVTRFPFTHVALAISDTHIIEANRFIKTRIVELEFDKTLHALYRLPDLTNEKQQRVKERGLFFQGYPYDGLQIFSWFLQLVFNLEHSFFNRANKLICSELIDYAFIAGGVERKKMDRIGDLTPGMLLDYYDLREVRR